MMSQKDLSFLSLPQLLELYESEAPSNQTQTKQQLLLLILTHEQIKPNLKNQALIIKRIFTYNHLSVLMDYLKQEHQQDAQLLATVKYDPSGQYIPLCLKLPFMAMQILCCQCQIINEMLFTGSADNPIPLLPKLLEFLDHTQHYHLASYFSKVICAVTKRVSPPTNKYNPIFSKWIFGENQTEQALENSSLFKSIKHFYSLSTIEYITKWLLISSKTTQKQEIDGQVVQKAIIDFRRPVKIIFLLKLLQIINTNKLDIEIMSNIPSLFDQMLTYQDKSKKLPSLSSFKSLGPSNQASKITLYDLAVEQSIIYEVFKVPQEGCLNLAKITLIKVYLNNYNLQIQRFNKQKNEDNQQLPAKLLQGINSDNLFYLFEWVVEHIKTFLKVTKKQISSQSSSHLQNQSIQNSRITLNSSQKMLILQLCELLRILHSLQTCRLQIVQYYNEHSITLVNVVKRLMNIQNNLIHLQTSKIILSLIKPKNKDKGSSIPYDFANKLLRNVLLQLIEINSLRTHMLEWADILLSLQAEHIFQDYQEEFQWEHIRQMIEEAKQIHIGQYRFIQSNIDCFYSQEKALIKYSHFLHDFKPIVVYEDKKEGKLILTEKKINLNVENSTEPTQAEDGQSEEANLFFLNAVRGNYLQFDVNDLIKEL